jgi:hypothetical protein
LRLPHDPRLLAWVVGIDKSWGGKKDLLELEKLDAFDSIGLSVQVMKSKRGAVLRRSLFPLLCQLGI